MRLRHNSSNNQSSALPLFLKEKCNIYSYTFFAKIKIYVYTDSRITLKQYNNTLHISFLQKHGIIISWFPDLSFSVFLYLQICCFPCKFRIQ